MACYAVSYIEIIARCAPDSFRSLGQACCCFCLHLLKSLKHTAGTHSNRSSPLTTAFYALRYAHCACHSRCISCNFVAGILNEVPQSVLE